MSVCVGGGGVSVRGGGVSVCEFCQSVSGEYC